MSPYQERVVKEKAELDAKLTALTAFLGGVVFDSLTPTEKGFLTEQRHYMELYSKVLGARAYFIEPGET